MKRIVIYRDSEVKGKRVRTVLRAIRPGSTWQGYSKNGSIIDSEVRNLARVLEPSFTGFYVA